MRTALHQSGASEKSGGKPAFPTMRLLILFHCFYVERLSSADDHLVFAQLSVRKTGLPPLLLGSRSTKGVDFHES